MAITLSRLLHSAGEHYGIRLLAGRDGMKSLVRWVHTVEDDQVPAFLHGGELVFTTGIAHPGGETGWLTSFAEALRAHGAVGLVLNLGPWLPEIPGSLLEWCSAADFPLFTLPWEVRLTDVTYDFCHRIMAAEEDESGLVNAFRALLFGRPDRDAQLPLLARRGFYNAGDYTLMLLSARRGRTRLPAEEWDPMKFGVQETLVRCFDKPFFLFTQDHFLTVVGAGASGEELEVCEARLRSGPFAERPELTVFAGISDTTVGLSGLASCYKQALAAVSAAETAGERVLRYGQLTFHKLIYAVEDASVLRRYVDDTLGEIIRYDAQHGTDHLEVLRRYLDCSGSIHRVAEEMGVHRNTINYKIRTIRALFGLTLDSRDTAALYLAFQVRDTLQNLLWTE